MINYYSSFSLIATVVCAALAVFVYASNNKNLENISFALLTIATGIWTSFPFVTTVISDKKLIDLTGAVIYVSAIFTPVAFLFFCLVLTNLIGIAREKYILSGSILLACLFTYLNFNGSLITGVLQINGVRAVIPGRYYVLFIIFFTVVCGYGYLRIILSYKNTAGIKRNKFKYMFLGTLCGYVAALIHFQTAYSGSEYFPHDILIILFMGIVSYAITKYRIMDIHLLTREFAIYLTFVIVYLVPAVVIYNIAQSLIAVTGYLLIGGLSIPVLYPFIKRTLLPFYEAALFRGKNDYLKELPQLSEKWALIKHVDQLLKTFVFDIAHIMKLTSANIMLFDVSSKNFIVKSYYSDSPAKTQYDFSLPDASPLIRFLEDHKSLVIKEEFEHTGDVAINQRILDDMKHVHAELTIPIMMNGAVKGILNLGKKKSNEMFNQEDMNALLSASNDAVVLLGYAESIDIQSETVYRYSHDLKNPLTPVQTYLYMFLHGQAGNLTEEQLNLLTLMDKNVRFVSQGLTDMYEISKISHADQHSHVQFKTFDINKALSIIIKSHQTQARDKNITLTFTSEPGALKFYGYEYGIEQMMRNFIQNALKFTKEGSIEAVLDNQDTYIVIRIRDTGAGIPEEDLPHVFKPFFRTKEQGSIIEGSGLGLAIAREIVILHKGRVTVASKKEEGTMLTIVLPLLPEEEI